jgi:hypothetical protein
MRLGGVAMLAWSLGDMVYLLTIGMGWDHLFGQLDQISGGAGWVGAGLLGVVLGWVFLIRWPANDKMIDKMIESRDKTVENLVTSHEDHVKSLVAAWTATDKERREEFKGSLQMILSYTQARDAQMAKDMASRDSVVDRRLEEFTQAVIDFRRTMEDLRTGDVNDRSTTRQREQH